MEFEFLSKEFTIYSKTGCFYCIKAKSLLKEKNLVHTIINCDDYILEDKVSFLEHIYKLAGKEVKTFPMIFYQEKFIGGYEETIDFIDKMLLSFDDNIIF
jgi:glutaredoxin 3